MPLDHIQSTAIRIEYSIQTLAFLRWIAQQVVTTLPFMVQQITRAAGTVPCPEIGTSGGTTGFGVVADHVEYRAVELVAQCGWCSDVMETLVAIETEFFQHDRFVQTRGGLQMPL